MSKSRVDKWEDFTGHLACEPQTRCSAWLVCCCVAQGSQSHGIHAGQASPKVQRLRRSSYIYSSFTRHSWRKIQMKWRQATFKPGGCLQPGLLKLPIYVAQGPVPRRSGRRAGRPVSTRKRSFVSFCSIVLNVLPPLNLAMHIRQRRRWRCRLRQNVSEGKPALFVSRPLFSVPQRVLRDSGRARRDPSLGSCDGELHPP